MNQEEKTEETDELTGSEIAIIGMTGRFPGANDLESFWRIIRDGQDTVTHFSDEQLRAAGFSDEILKNPSYVKARGTIDDIETFDAAFFGYSPRDALAMDPQQRLFLEGAWQALELAGYNPQSYNGLIGMYGGSTLSSYQHYAAANIDPRAGVDPMAIALGNEISYLTTRVSYKLDLKGPSYPIQTACSTSLVAVHLACQGLLNAECDIALAGGASVRVPQENGYAYQEGGIVSPDGRCRSFDANARGTVFSNGYGMVVLKRLEDALAHGDRIHAVILGSAINNDGSQKASFTAPGVGGQTEVIADAIANAGIDPETIDYIEAHGTGTALGDSIEIQALAAAFAPYTSRSQFCALGAVKANIGHTDTVAGIAGLIKTVLTMQRRQLPPMAHFESPNPDIDFSATPFFVNKHLVDWPETDSPRRAGVSSFGFGGTNAHVILEEAPAVEPSGSSRRLQILPISAGSEQGLEEATANLAAHFRNHAQTNLADCAFTLAVGRQAFAHRRVITSANVEKAVASLEACDAQSTFSALHDGPQRPVVFMFTGQGSQYVNMGRELYETERVYREQVDRCCEHLLSLGFDIDLRDLLHPDGEVTEAQTKRLTQTGTTQVALFVVEYALAQLWMSWGVQPAACIGHSIGEYVAACLSGVLQLEDALRLVMLRGRLMESMPPGVMVAVPLPEERVRPLLGDDLWLSVINGPSLCVVSGTEAAIDGFCSRMSEDNVACQRLHTSHAFHSGLMDEAVGPFVEAAGQVAFGSAEIPYLSNVTGDWITAAQIEDAGYWGSQIRQAVRFSDGLAKLAEQADRVYLEVGPGNTLSSLARRQLGMGATVLSSLPHAAQQDPAIEMMLTTLGRLWLNGVTVDWKGFYADQRRLRVPLPTYPFQKTRHWIERRKGKGLRQRQVLPREGRIPDVRQWLYTPAWTRRHLSLLRDHSELDEQKRNWLVFVSEHDFCSEVVQQLQATGQQVTTVRNGQEFSQTDTAYSIDERKLDHYEKLISEIARSNREPNVVLHLWGLSDFEDGAPFSTAAHDHGFGSLLLLARALGESQITDPIRLSVVSNGALDVTGDEPLCPTKASMLGLCRVIAQEYPNVSCRNFDLSNSACDQHREAVAGSLLLDILSSSRDALVSYRGKHRWVQAFEPLTVDETDGQTPACLRHEGVYVITGGLGEIGLEFAEYLARTVQARLLLTGRSGLPPDDQWDEYLAKKPQNDAISQRILRVKNLRNLGSQVVVAAADAADRTQMQAALDLARNQLGPLNGVIHAAGVVAGDGFKPIAETDQELCRRQFEPKIDGLYLLDELIRGEKLDFCMLVSSLSSILGGIRYAAYASANAFMDSFAHQRNRFGSFPWITVNWDAWLRRDEAERLEKSGASPGGLVMTPSEGVQAFSHILAIDAGVQVVVSTGDLDTRIEQWAQSDAHKGPDAEDGEPPARHPRPQLQTEYAAPSTEMEQDIATIWQELLGIDRVGVNDNFFELGGDSLLGIQVIARIKRDLSVSASAASLYEGPSVSSLARIVGADGGQQDEVFDQSRSRGEKRRERKRRRQTPTEAE